MLKIISGGQTGVDRGALEAAAEAGSPHGGWCPLGRLAEDGRVPERFNLRETDSPDYQRRTELNVLEADATLILCRGPLSGGSALTRRLARKHRRPSLVVVLDGGAIDKQIDRVRRWLKRHKVETLNVAGPRESQSPGIAAMAREFVARLLDAIR
jgi:hypothetical protein